VLPGAGRADGDGVVSSVFSVFLPACTAKVLRGVLRVRSAAMRRRGLRVTTG